MNFAWKPMVLMVCGVFLALCGGSVAVVHAFGDTGLAQEAVLIGFLCAGERDSESRLECYRQRIPNLYPTRTVPELFTLIERGARFDPLLRDCHFIAHRIGEVAVADNPSAWTSLIGQESASGLCSYGYVHGVTIAAYSHEGLTEEEVVREMPRFQGACVDGGRNLKEGCIHALGHMMYYIAGGDITKALPYCDEATRLLEKGDGPFTPERRCYTGVMMMPFFSFIDPDWTEATRYELTRENVRAFCEGLSNTAYTGACLRASWPLFAEEVQADGGVDRFCEVQPNATETEWCYAKVFVALGWLNVNDLDTMSRQCEATSKTWQSSCYVHATKEYLSEGAGIRAMPTATKLCLRASDERVRSACLGALSRSAGAYTALGGKEREDFCAPLPEAWRDVCEQASEY